LMVREVTSFPLRKNRNYTNGCPCLWKEKAGIEKKHVPKLSMVEKKNKRSLCLWWYHIVATRVLRLPASRSCFFVCLFVCFAVWGFELRDSLLLSRCFTTWAIPPAPDLLIYKYLIPGWHVNSRKHSHKVTS
jgi:hypothetical protein